MPRTGATRAEFEAKISDGSDLVGAWCEYVRWAESQPGGAAVLERACLDLAKHPQHRNDVRHLRLWVLHADTLESPLKVFQYLESNNIGTEHALLFEAWATALEQQRQFSAVEEVYCRGIESQPKPLERLQKNYAEFRRRMRKREARGNSHAVRRPGFTQEAQAEPVADCAERERGSARGSCESLEETGTHEVTINGVQALLKNVEGRNSEAAWEEPTYTMDIARRDVLGLLAEGWMSGETSSLSLSCDDMDVKAGDIFPPARAHENNFLDVFEETDFLRAPE